MDPFQQSVAESPAVVLTKIAAQAFPKGATAQCLKCSNSRSMDQDDLVKMMQLGYPRCCGERMQIEAIK